MTGKELIIYILQNDLEDAEIFKDGVFVGFISEQEAAVKFGVVVSRVRTWYWTGVLKGIQVGESIIFLNNVTDPRKGVST